MTYDYYLKQSKSMCEIKLSEIIAGNPKHTNCFKKILQHSLSEILCTLEVESKH